MLAIVWAIKHFRPYLFGRKFIVVTDHKPLIWLFRVKDPGSRLLKWRIKLEEFDFEIIYKSGKMNTNADALSRMPTTINLIETNESVDSSGEESDTNNDSEIEKIDKEDSERKLKILSDFHNSPLGGHSGMNRTYKRLKQFYFWQGMKNDVENYIRKCLECQKNNATKPNTKMPLTITTTAREPFEKCFMGIVGPLTKSSNGNKYILTFQDDLSKFSLAIPIPIQDADTVSRAFVENIILIFGTPLQLLTDCGTNFLSDIFSNMAKLFQIKKLKTTSYHPQTNGALERTHKTLVEYLRHFIKEDQSDLDLWIPFAIFFLTQLPIRRQSLLHLNYCLVESRRFQILLGNPQN